MLKILLEAPVLTQSGYGVHSRLVLRSLMTMDNVEIFINPLNWGSTSWNNSLNDQETDFVNDAIRKLAEAAHLQKTSKIDPNFDIQVHVGIPNEFQKKAKHSVCVTAGIETDRVSANWLVKTHEGINKLIVPSVHSKNGFINTSYEATNSNTGQKTIINCNCEVDVIPYPVEEINSRPLDFEMSTKFNFLAVALFGKRKNIENMVRWFLEEFENDDVGLLLKTGHARGSNSDFLLSKKVLKSLVGKKKRKCKIYLLHGSLSDAEIHSLYKREDVHCYVSATHGEGFGLPIFEAAYSNLPIVATNWSAHLDFLSAPYKENGKLKDKQLFAKVDYDLKEISPDTVWDQILIEGSRWAYPKEKSFKDQIRKVYKNHGMYKKWSSELQKHILKNYQKDKILEQMRKSIVSVLPENINSQASEVVVFE